MRFMQRQMLPEGLRYMIESEKAYNRKKNHGDLGVRVQTSGIHSDITAETAISNVITLRRMRADYDLFNQQLSILGRNESRIFRGYLSGEKDIGEIAEEEGIQYEFAAQRARRAKVKIKV